MSFTASDEDIDKALVEAQLPALLAAIAHLTGDLAILRPHLRPDPLLLDVRSDVHDAFNDRIDQGNKEMAWGVATVNSWYRNDKGRVAQNWPFSLLEYWELTRHPQLEQFITA